MSFVDGLLASKEIVNDFFSRRILSQKSWYVPSPDFLADFSSLPASVSSVIRSRYQQSTS